MVIPLKQLEYKAGLIKVKLLREVNVSQFKDDRGHLNVFEFSEDNYFEVKRFYYIKNVPLGESRGSHAHKELKQIFFALAGSFVLEVTDGEQIEKVSVKSESCGYSVSEGLWRELKDFTEDAICLVMASKEYASSDYLHSYQEFLEFKNAKR